MSQREQDRLDVAATHAHEYLVEGVGDFPFDMLRYDNCWPATEADAYKLLARQGKDRARPRIVMLRGLRPPTVGRWESFSWKVVEG
jgi:hypothetical protein